MNLFTVDFQSASLHKQTTVNVLCPSGIGRKTECASLLLLHGMTDDQTGWMRRSLAENYAEEQGLCLIIPNADLSFYTDMAYGGDYLTFLAEELPDFLGNYFPLTKEKKGRYVAGNSMGGYGAFLMAMRYPQMFQAAFSLSGPMKIYWIHRILSDRRLIDLYKTDKNGRCREYIKQIVDGEGIPELLVNSLLESGDMVRIFQSMFGENISLLEGSNVDLLHLVQRKEFLENAVDLYAYCGEQDYHYASNLIFQKEITKLGYSYSLGTGEGGHDWTYWNKKLPEVFDIIMKYGDDEKEKGQ